MDEYVYKIDFCVTYTNSHRHTNVRVSHCTWTHTHTYTVAHMQSTYIRIQHMIFHYCHYYCYYFCHIARCLSLHLHFRFDFTTFVCVYVCVFFFFKYEQKVYRNWANVNKVELFYYDDEKKIDFVWFAIGCGYTKTFFFYSFKWIMKFYSSFFYAHIQYSTWVYSTNNNVNIVYQVCVCGVRKKKIHLLRWTPSQ